MDILNLFWNASQEDLRNGYVDEEDYFICLLCGKKIEKGIVYQEEGVFYEAGRFMRVHIEKVHGSVFEYLIQLDKKFTGLTDHQNSLLRLFYQGKSDDEVKIEMEIGSASTIRNHRFALKEKERQSRVFLTMMDLLKIKDKKAVFIPPHSTARMVDDRYSITEEEKIKILRKNFPEGLDGPIKTFDIKEKSKLAVLGQIAKRFETNRIYSEKEVNEILKGAFEDFTTLRRYLIEYGFMDRKPDGSQYWLEENQDMRDVGMDRKKELKEQYKEMKTEAGVYQIRNTKNQKVLVVATSNLKTINGKIMQLRNGGVHMNKQLQEEWNQFGEATFVFEVLEVLEEKEEGYFERS